MPNRLPATPVRIPIVDDHPIVVGGCRATLSAEIHAARAIELGVPGYAGKAGDPAELVAAVSRGSRSIVPGDRHG